MNETITWIPVAEHLPDDDTSVLICTDGTAVPVWIGYHYRDRWIDTEGFEVNVKAWADLPRGVQS